MIVVVGLEIFAGVIIVAAIFVAVMILSWVFHR